MCRRVVGLCVVVSMAVAVCAVACLSVRVSPSRGGGVVYPSVSCDLVVCYVVSCRAFFVSCSVGFDTPRNASVSNGFKLSGLSGLTFPIGNTYDGANKTNEH